MTNKELAAKIIRASNWIEQQQRKAGADYIIVGGRTARMLEKQLLILERRKKLEKLNEKIQSNQKEQ